MQVESNEAHLSTPLRRIEVLCAPPRAEESERATSDTTGRSGANAGGQPAPAPRVIHPPGARLDDIMRAFREQRRLAQQEGESAGVIETVLARRGKGSLAADLASKQ